MKKIKQTIHLLVIISLIVLLNACTTIPNPYGYTASDKVKPMMAQKEINAEELLDVSIKLFDPGVLPEDEDDRKGLSEQIRNSEARFMPIHLKYTMQRTGYWGNVRVIPEESEGSELLIKGKILESDGETIELNIQVFDATNKKWFEKEYSHMVRNEDREETEIERHDTFQNVYNEISNDIIKYRQKLTPNEIENIKEISQIRFAKYMSPDIYSNYLKKESNGQYKINQLPSTDDPMIGRINAIKSRDEMLVDTINNYYDIYYTDMWESYDNWRKYRSEELGAIREIENKALTQKALGIAAIVGAIALGASKNSEVVDRTGALRTVMIAGGGYALYSGIQTSKESEMNKEALEELGDSFATEIDPIVIDIEGKTTKLTGSADQQYAKWKQLLKEIYHKETGF
ncbi:MAG: hypothetical protein OQL19_17990 [Gammaproteobacteria bacterium]|nr:hypothetical protein [Gammaproteobacteria bacterium]